MDDTQEQQEQASEETELATRHTGLFPDDVQADGAVLSLPCEGRENALTLGRLLVNLPVIMNLPVILLALVLAVFVWPRLPETEENY